MPESGSIDLHDLTAAQAIKEFVRFYNTCLRSGYHGRIEVIHGYGSTGAGGAIRKELRKYLAANAERIEQFIAGESLGNPGATIVYPHRLLAESPQLQGATTVPNAAGEAILRFCNTPKTKERVLAKLTGRFGDRVLIAEIRTLVQNRSLEAIESGDGTIQFRARAEFD